MNIFYTVFLKKFILNSNYSIFIYIKIKLRIDLFIIQIYWAIYTIKTCVNNHKKEFIVIIPQF